MRRGEGRKSEGGVGKEGRKSEEGEGRKSEEEGRKEE